MLSLSKHEAATTRAAILPSPSYPSYTPVDLGHMKAPRRLVLGN
jgi:hypothetical protein